MLYLLMLKNIYNTFSSQGTENPPFRFFWDTRYNYFLGLDTEKILIVGWEPEGGNVVIPPFHSSRRDRWKTIWQISQRSWRSFSNTPFPQRRDRWQTIERPQDWTDLNGISVNTQWSLTRCPMISQRSLSERYGRHGLHRILNWFKTVSQWSLREAGLSMNAQWSLNERSTVSPIFQ